MPFINGMLEGAIQPINPNPITFKSVLSQFLSKLQSDKLMSQNMSRIKENHHDELYNSINCYNFISLRDDYQVNFPPDACARLKGFLAVTGDFRKPTER